MPVYIYRCQECKGEFEKKHRMSENIDDCTLCNSKDCVFRIPCLSDPIKTTEKKKTGDIVKKFISDTEKEVKKEKQSLTSKVK